ncbi:MAG: hypothetical protein M3143_09675 [Actinomycetota bacterium]|nr:hypothetical protein [Actinomycetota bacterium]
MSPMVDEFDCGQAGRIHLVSDHARVGSLERDQMNSYALVAALGLDAVAAVRGYRLQVIPQAQRRGLSLVSEALPDLVRLPAGALLVDPINIRLTFLHNPDRIDLAGRMLKWNPAQGWSLSHSGAYAPISYYAGSGATALHLVPHAAQVIEWATGDLGTPPSGGSRPPTGVELDDDPRAIQRLLGFIHPHGHPRKQETPSPPHRPQGHAMRRPPTAFHRAADHGPYR